MYTKVFKILYAFVISPYVLYALPISSFIWSKIFTKVWITALVIMQKYKIF
jgi:hypothetical protein